MTLAVRRPDERVIRRAVRDLTTEHVRNAGVFAHHDARREARAMRDLPLTGDAMRAATGRLLHATARRRACLDELISRAFGGC